MAPAHAAPRTTIEVLDPADALTAVESNSADQFSRTTTFMEPQGCDFSVFVEWAILDVNAAAALPDGKDKARFLVSALMNARRGLSNLVDQYLRRDGFAFCSDAPRDAESKAALLVRRGIFDQLAADALARAVDRRNRVEHQYEFPSSADTQDTIQLVRATVDGALVRSDPKCSPAFFGSFSGGYKLTPAGEEFWFDSWSGLVFVFALSEPEPWFGVVIPTTDTEAALRRAPLRSFSCEQLLALHVALERLPDGGVSGYGAKIFRGQLESAGLLA
ncbi:MAG: hypothetical protein KBI44_06075 [Thermoanaerobaculia bacterium]|nr:hypothetical protein [Thermoanaerobaculia bacterium]